ncbi:FAD-dependent monooxygenase [Spongiactinospora rosea]|uniref:FAD-dependent monooxygenase n=1 Tax=Spongiactinospora rosea TaxID=2248750 RepID=UPI001CED3D97|nr:FAD-dependent monooxygenase [Spongiactinospora rosea]
MNGTAVVIGGGIGGLAAALALHRIGWQAIVLERSPELGEIGAGMSQSPNALRALDELGVGRQARAAGVPTYATGNLRTPGGRYLQRSRPGDATPLLAFRRADLHRMLLEALPPGWVRTGCEVAGIDTGSHTGSHTGAGAATVRFGGSELSAEVIVWLPTASAARHAGCCGPTRCPRASSAGRPGSALPRSTACRAA